MTKQKKPQETEADETRPAAEDRSTGNGESALAELQAELEQTKAQAAEYLDGWKRAQAELANYRKRVDRDAENLRLQAAGQAAIRWLPILDDVERALRDRPAGEQHDSWLAGWELIYRKGLSALEAEGVTPIDSDAGDSFDPNLHEAVSIEPCAERKDGEILDVVRHGYRLGARILRPAQVRVACPPKEHPAESADPAESE